ncbi:MAG: hypothetical protein ACKVP0_15585 [Pirellulaceae bacterium]
MRTSTYVKSPRRKSPFRMAFTASLNPPGGGKLIHDSRASEIDPKSQLA